MLWRKVHARNTPGNCLTRATRLSNARGLEHALVRTVHGTSAIYSPASFPVVVTMMMILLIAVTHTLDTAGPIRCVV